MDTPALRHTSSRAVQGRIENCDEVLETLAELRNRIEQREKTPELLKDLLLIAHCEGVTQAIRKCADW